MHSINTKLCILPIDDTLYILNSPISCPFLSGALFTSTFKSKLISSSFFLCSSAIWNFLIFLRIHKSQISVADSGADRQREVEKERGRQRELYNKMCAEMSRQRERDRESKQASLSESVANLFHEDWVGYSQATAGVEPVGLSICQYFFTLLLLAPLLHLSLCTLSPSLGLTLNA